MAESDDKTAANEARALRERQKELKAKVMGLLKELETLKVEFDAISADPQAAADLQTPEARALRARRREILERRRTAKVDLDSSRAEQQAMYATQRAAAAG